MAKRTSEFGSLYRGREGQWTWIMHRASGVAILVFLLAHIVDTALVGWGPEAYNRVVAIYHNPIVEIMELALVGAVIFHAINGLRIMVLDFWPATAEKHRQLTWLTYALVAGAMAPITWIMGRRIIEGLF